MSGRVVGVSMIGLALGCGHARANVPEQHFHPSAVITADSARTRAPLPDRYRAWLELLPPVELAEPTFDGDFVVGLLEDLDCIDRGCARPRDHGTAVPEPAWLVDARRAEALGRRDLARGCLGRIEQLLAVRCGDEDCDALAVLRELVAIDLLERAFTELAHGMPRERVARLAGQAQSLSSNTELVLDASLLQHEPEPSAIAAVREQSGEIGALTPTSTRFVVPLGMRNHAHELFERGRDAIPDLIDGIDDPTPTRIVRLDPDRPGHYRAVTTGELSLAIIEQIAGRGFSGAGDVRDWWSRSAPLADRDALRHDLTTAPERDRPVIAQRLLARFGMSVFGELEDAFHRTRHPQTRASVLAIMASGPDHELPGVLGPAVPGALPRPGAARDRIVDFVRTALRDRDRRVRRVAGSILLRDGLDDGVRVVLRDLARHQRHREDRFASEHRAYFALAIAAGTPDAAATVVRHFTHEDPAVRRAAVESIEIGCSPGCWTDPEVRTAVMGGLVQVMQSPGDDRDVDEPIRFVAARAFAAMFEIPELLRATAPMWARDRQLLALVNDYRRQHGRAPMVRPELELPSARPRPTRADADQLRRVHVTGGPARAQTSARTRLEVALGTPVSISWLADQASALLAETPGVRWRMRIVRTPNARGVVLIVEPSTTPMSSSQTVGYRVEHRDGSTPRIGLGQAIVGDLDRILSRTMSDLDATWDAIDDRTRETVIELWLTPPAKGT